MNAEGKIHHILFSSLASDTFNGLEVALNLVLYTFEFMEWELEVRCIRMVFDGAGIHEDMVVDCTKLLL